MSNPDFSLAQLPIIWLTKTPLRPPPLAFSPLLPGSRVPRVPDRVGDHLGNGIKGLKNSSDGLKHVETISMMVNFFGGTCHCLMQLWTFIGFHRISFRISLCKWWLNWCLTCIRTVSEVVLPKRMHKTKEKQRNQTKKTNQKNITKQQKQSNWKTKTQQKSQREKTKTTQIGFQCWFWRTHLEHLLNKWKTEKPYNFESGIESSVESGLVSFNRLGKKTQM